MKHFAEEFIYLEVIKSCNLYQVEIKNIASVFGQKFYILFYRVFPLIFYFTGDFNIFSYNAV